MREPVPVQGPGPVVFEPLQFAAVCDAADGVERRAKRARKSAASPVGSRRVGREQELVILAPAGGCFDVCPLGRGGYGRCRSRRLPPSRSMMWRMSEASPSERSIMACTSERAPSQMPRPLGAAGYGGLRRRGCRSVRRGCHAVRRPKVRVLRRRVSRRPGRAPLRRLMCASAMRPMAVTLIVMPAAERVVSPPASVTPNASESSR